MPLFMDNYFSCQDGLNVSKPNTTKSYEPEKKSPFKNNTYLDVSGQHLYDFRPLQYTHLNDIRYLYLKNNQLKSLDAATFKIFPNLVWIDLRNNELTSFPSTVNHAPNITTILLENNNLQELPVEIGSLKYLKSVLLRGNPLLSPLREIVEHGPKKTTEYLKNKWYQHSGTQPPDEEELEDNSRRNSLTNIKRKLSKSDAQVSFDSVGSMWSDEIRVAMEQQERYLQKKRDVEALKEWRKQYSSMPKLGSKDQPPYGLDDRYLKIMSRDDIRKPTSRSPSRKRAQKNKRNVDEDFLQIQKSLFEIRKTCFRLPENADELQKIKFAKGNQINKLRELQKKLEDMKMKY